MQPYYQDDHVTIYHGDCREVMADLPRGEVGVVLTSPPYNLGGYSPSNTEFSGLSNGYDVHGDNMPHAEYVSWQRDVLRHAWELLADDGAIFYQHKPLVGGNVARLPFELVPDHLPIRQVVTWDRGSGFNRQFTYFVPSYEWVLLITKPAFRINTRSVFDVWRIPPTPEAEQGDHPAPFPLKLATTAIASTDAALVLDPFMGSGTTLRAAKDLGRKAIGIEISERYCEIAAKRMGQEVLF